MTYVCYLPSMKRTTVFLEEDSERELEALAARDGRGKSEMIREAISEYVARRAGERGLPGFTAAGASGRSDTAERHEEILFADED